MCKHWSQVLPFVLPTELRLSLNLMDPSEILYSFSIGSGFSIFCSTEDIKKQVIIHHFQYFSRPSSSAFLSLLITPFPSTSHSLYCVIMHLLSVRPYFKGLRNAPTLTP